MTRSPAVSPKEGRKGAADGGTKVVEEQTAAMTQLQGHVRNQKDERCDSSAS
jgi:hypothetical protein